MKQERREATHSPASLVRRALACLVDLLIFGGLSLLMAVMVQAYFSALPFKNRVVVLLFVLGFGGLCYFPGMECSIAMGTPGKRVCGIRVADRGGGKISNMRALFRNLIKAALLVLFPVSVVMIMKSGRRQALHDRLAGTQILLKH